MFYDVEMGYITFDIRLSFLLISFSDISHGFYVEHVICDNQVAKLNCSVGNSIDDINIYDVQDACSSTDDVNKRTMLALDSTSYSSCIDHNSCVISNKMINGSHSVLDKTSKLIIRFHCVRIRDHDHYRTPTLSVSPFKIKSVNCTHSDRRIEIQSVELKQNVSFCEKQNLHESLTKCIQMKVNAACNGKQICEQLTWYEPKFVNISFSCKALSPHVSLQDETNVVSVAVGVTVGLITIVGVIVVFIWFVRRKVTDDKQNIHVTNQRDGNKYSIGNENTAIASDSNYEMLTTGQESRCYDELNQDFRKQSSRDQPDRNNMDIENEYIIPCPVTEDNKSKHANEDQTVNHVESNIGTGIGEQTMTSLSNSADYFTVL